MNNEITNKLNLILIVIGLFLGIVLGLFLLLSNSKKTKANTLLGLLVLISLAYFLPGFLYRFSWLEQFPHAIGWTRVVNYLLGPLTYLYVRACIQKGFEMRPKEYLHFIPFVLGMIYQMPSLIQSGAEKLTIFYNVVALKNPVVGSFEIFVQATYLLVYFGMSIQLIRKYKRHLSNATSAVDHSFYNWVLIFIVIHALPVFGMIIAYSVLNSSIRFTFMIVLLSFLSFSLAVLLAIMIKPELFHAFPHQMPLPSSTEDKKQKYENSNLSEDKKDLYAKKLIQHVELNKPFLEPELTLAELSEQAGLPPYQISQIINEKLNCNFLEFINGYRVEEVKSLLADPKYDHYTIIAIAYEVGFNSKSAFYSAFKKHAGTTPGSYRKSLKTEQTT